jgi:hypothetical protein
MISVALSLVLKRPGHESDYLSPSSAEVKNAWSYTSTPQYAFIEWCSIKSTGTLHFYHAMKAYWGVEVQLHAFLTSALDGDESLVPTGQEDGWASEPGWMQR